MNYNIRLMVICAFVLIANVASYAGMHDQTAIVIGEHVITQTEYLRKKSLYAKLNKVRLTNAQDRLAFEKDFRHFLIDQEVQLYTGRRMDIVLETQDYKQIMKGLLVKYQVSDESSLREVIAEQGIDYAAFKAFVQDQYLLQKIQGMVLRNQVQVGEGELDKKYQAMLKANEQLYVEDIFFNTEMASDAQKARLFAQSKQVSTFWKKGIYLHDTVPKKSELLTFKWQRLSQFPDEFQSVVKDMKPSEVSEPILTDNGYHVLKVIKRKASPATESKATFGQRLHEQRVLDAIPTWVEDLKRQVYIQVQMGAQ